MSEVSSFMFRTLNLHFRGIQFDLFRRDELRESPNSFKLKKRDSCNSSFRFVTRKFIRLRREIFA